MSLFWKDWGHGPFVYPANAIDSCQQGVLVGVWLVQVRQKFKERFMFQMKASSVILIDSDENIRLSKKPWFLKNHKKRMGLVRITSWYPNFNGSHFGLPPSEIHRMTGPPPKIVWTMTYSHRPHWKAYLLEQRPLTRNWEISQTVSPLHDGQVWTGASCMCPRSVVAGQCPTLACCWLEHRRYFPERKLTKQERHWNRMYLGIKNSMEPLWLDWVAILWETMTYSHRPHGNRMNMLHGKMGKHKGRLYSFSTLFYQGTFSLDQVRFCGPTGGW